jgi:translation initiation factor 1
MSKNKKNSSGGFVFSTDPNFKPFEDETPETSLPADKQVLRIWLDRVKGGKEATVIKGFVMTDDDLSDLARQLKNKCATGGNAKDGNIILQGDHRDKVLAMLQTLGYKNVKKAGG